MRAREDHAASTLPISFRLAPRANNAWISISRLAPACSIRATRGCVDRIRSASSRCVRPRARRFSRTFCARRTRISTISASSSARPRRSCTEPSVHPFGSFFLTTVVPLEAALAEIDDAARCDPRSLLEPVDDQNGIHVDSIDDSPVHLRLPVRHPKLVNPTPDSRHGARCRHRQHLTSLKPSQEVASLYSRDPAQRRRSERVDHPAKRLVGRTEHISKRVCGKEAASNEDLGARDRLQRQLLFACAPLRPVPSVRVARGA